MSVRMSNAVWKHGPRKANYVLVLLAIADFANDEGYAYPSVLTIAEKCRFSKRNLLLIIGRLVADGWMTKVPSPKGYRANAYQLNSAKLSPDAFSGENFNTSQVRDASTSGAKSRIPILINHQEEPSVNHQRLEGEVGLSLSSIKKEEYIPPGWIDPEAWTGYLEVRRHKRAVMTIRALTAVVLRLEQFLAEGHDPNEILRTSVRSNWTDVWAPKGTINGIGNHSQQFKPTAVIREESNHSALFRALQREVSLAKAGEDHGSRLSLGSGNERQRE